MITRTQAGDVAVLRLEHGKVNALDVELLTRLDTLLAEEEATDASAVVLTGAGSCLSAGLDLRRLLDGGAAYISSLLPALSASFERLASFPKPLVVAANGHAIAGGCVMLLAADWRLVAAGGARVGLTELPVGVPFPGVAFEIVRAAVPRRYLRELIYRGQTYPVERALAMGLCDEVCDGEALDARAVEIATELGRIPPETFRIAKQQITRSRRDRVSRHDDVADRWLAPDVLAAIQRYADRHL